MTKFQETQQNNGINIFIDDERNPVSGDWVIVRKYVEFLKLMGDCQNANIPIKQVSFDHDLGENSLTGMDCLYAIAGFILDGAKTFDQLERFIFHSSNPIGLENMTKYCETMIKHNVIPNGVEIEVLSSTNTLGWAEMPDLPVIPSKSVSDVMIAVDHCIQEFEEVFLKFKSLDIDINAVTEDANLISLYRSKIDNLEKHIVAFQGSVQPIDNNDDTRRFIKRYVNSDEDFTISDAHIEHVIDALNHRIDYTLNYCHYSDTLFLDKVITEIEQQKGSRK